MLKVALLVLGLGVGLYMLALVVLFFSQTRMIFPGAAGPAPIVPSGTERLALEVGNGDRLHGVHIAPQGSGSGDAPVVLGFGGNAWNAEMAALTLHDIFPHADIVTFHYRGYAPSTGTPGADALLHDAPLVFDEVSHRFPGRRVVITGFSIGSAAAARLSVERPVAGVILVTPFDSLVSVAQSHFPWAPVRLLLREKLDPIADIRKTKVPVAVIVADQDQIVPRSSTDALAGSATTLALKIVIPDSDHNSIYLDPQFAGAMREALAQMK